MAINNGSPGKRLSPDDVRDMQFSTTRLRPGYDEDEVDAFLDRVEAEMRRLTWERDTARAGGALEPAELPSGVRMIRPDARLQASFLEAMAEFEPRAGYGTDVDIELLKDPTAFELYCQALTTGTLPYTRDRLGAQVHRFWWVDGQTWLGQGGIILNPDRGDDWDSPEFGHCWYVIRPSARRQGHGTALMRSLLIEAGKFGISPAVLWVKAGNIASQRAIEKCGGKPISETNGIVRYLAPTGESP